MTYNELNKYIRNYIEKDKTGRALMLSGEWGSGKSYYINKTLKPYLELQNENKNEKKHKCIVVSLYGLNDVSQISKAIYLELRSLKLFKNKSEAVVTVEAAASVVPKTIFNALTSKVGYDIGTVDEKTFKKVYESIKLNDKLVVFEDIERTHINHFELLGFINNICERDGAKVLLVCNESELLEYYDSEEEYVNSNNGNKETRIVSKPTKETERYLIEKEKTVGDTVLFRGDYSGAVKQIIKSFESDLLSGFAEEAEVKEILNMMHNYNNLNLRTFIYACQKTTDIYNYLDNEYSNDFIKTIFFGIILFCFRLKTGENPKWSGGDNYSLSLGNETFPLFKFCFDFIIYHFMDSEKISIAQKELKELRLYDKNNANKDPDVKIISCYFYYTEKEVIDAVNSITNRLSNIEDISFYDYGNIAVNLIEIKYITGYDISVAKRLLVKNLNGLGDNLQIEKIFHTFISTQEQSIQSEYDELYREMDHSLKNHNILIPDFNYLPEQSKLLYDYTIKNEKQIRNSRCFAKKLDILKLVNMFAKCTPRQKNDIRSAFLCVYQDVPKMFCYSDDVSSIEELLLGIDDVSFENDKVQLLQYQWFKENLKEILKVVI